MNKYTLLGTIDSNRQIKIKGFDKTQRLKDITNLSCGHCHQPLDVEKAYKIKKVGQNFYGTHSLVVCEQCVRKLIGPGYKLEAAYLEKI